MYTNNEKIVFIMLNHFIFSICESLVILIFSFALQGLGFFGLEVTVRDFQYKLRSSVGSLIVVGRIIPDYTAYK